MLLSQTVEYKASRNERKQLLQIAEYNASRMKENKFYNAEMIQTW